MLSNMNYLTQEILAEKSEKSRKAEIIFQELRKNNTASLNEILSDFNKGEIGVLCYLVFEEDHVTSSKLSEQLNVSTARIANILNSLATKNYIKRTEDLIDKRKTIVEVTPTGKQLVIAEKQKIIDKIILIIEKLGKEEILDYIRITSKIKNILNDIEEK